MSHHDTALCQRLQDRGVIIHAPHAVVLYDLDPARIEAGVEIYPGSTVCGPRTLLRRGTQLGRAGGGVFENIATGQRVKLFGGFFNDATFLDDVTVRGHAEMRGGTLMEERSEAAHHVGYKMTVTLPFVVAGSLLNFCDALVAGGTSRRDHSEIGSCLALYNFTPWGDKFASLFGDVPRGVFLRSSRIFIGGQTQIVSPVHVDFGATLAAGYAVRRAVAADRLYGETPGPLNTPLDTTRYGRLEHKVALTLRFIANLWCLHSWYTHVRLPQAHAPLHVGLLEHAQQQLTAGVRERLKRLQAIVDKLPASLAKHRAVLHQPDTDPARVQARIDEHTRLMRDWPTLEQHFAAPPQPPADVLKLFTTLCAAMAPDVSYLDNIRGLPDALVTRGQQVLTTWLNEYLHASGWVPGA